MGWAGWSWPAIPLALSKCDDILEVSFSKLYCVTAVVVHVQYSCCTYLKLNVGLENNVTGFLLKTVEMTCFKLK